MSTRQLSAWLAFVLCSVLAFARAAEAPPQAAQSFHNSGAVHERLGIWAVFSSDHFLRLNDERKNLERDIAALEKEIARFTAEVEQGKRARQDLARLNSELSAAEAAEKKLDRNPEFKRRQLDYIAHLRSQIDSTKLVADGANRETDLQDRQKKQDQKRLLLVDTERQIDRGLSIETNRYWLRFGVSFLFAALLAYLMARFFRVADADQEVRRLVFNAQSGIQFITLFSLVIAIVLFGVTGILEGKELSALLGGLSGYILGRVSFRDGSDGGGRPPAGKPEAPATGSSGAVAT